VGKGRVPAPLDRTFRSKTLPSEKTTGLATTFRSAETIFEGARGRECRMKRVKVTVCGEIKAFLDVTAALKAKNDVSLEKPE